MPPDSAIHIAQVTKRKERLSGTSFAGGGHYLSSTLRVGSEDLNLLDSVPLVFLTAATILEVCVIKMAHHSVDWSGY